MSLFESYEHLAANRERLSQIIDRLHAMRTSLRALPKIDQKADVLAANESCIKIMEQMLAQTKADLKAHEETRHPEEKCE